VTNTPPYRTALVYDFDGTLAPGNIQEHALLPNYLGVSKEDFWAAVATDKQLHDSDQILIYMKLLLDLARDKGLPLTREILARYGKETQFYYGVADWFERMNRYATDRGLSLEHYIVSSGNEEMIRGSSIASYFHRIFACKYIYDSEGQAVWPGTVVNYTTKTQFLFRINKGVSTYWDDERVNRWVPMAERDVPFSRMIYIGDGDTDIPSMKMVRHQGGHSIAVFDPSQWTEGNAQSRAYNLIAEDRANFVVPADYRNNSQLDVTVKGILGRIARDEGWRA
jgi:phosphoserine phosphatase